MDRAQLLLVGLPLFLFCSDIFHLFSPPPSKPAAHHHHHHHRHQPDSQPLIQQQQPSLEFPTQKASGIGFGNTVSIDFCSSCSYRGTAVTMKNMLESQFPGINVVLANYPPPLPKRMLSKLVPIVQFGVIGIIVGGEQIFPRLGFAAPPQWYYSMRANRFGVWQALGYLETSFSPSCRVQVLLKCTVMANWQLNVLWWKILLFPPALAPQEWSKTLC
ncbi:hypothetical protein Pfo_029931 [Paulownia fortunei]|nr:hypothetical protein Pfo_029931 [Paulownia fortunei]